MINSVEEIDEGMLAEGFDELDDFEKSFIEDQWHRDYLTRQNMKKAEDRNMGYWLDNCGDGEWYCQHCLQPDCLKRMAPRLL